MSKRCKSVLYVGFSCIVLFVVLIFVKLLFFNGFLTPLLKLHGDKHMEVEVNAHFVDPGVKARYRLVDDTDQVQVKSNVNMKKTGMYTIAYTVNKYNKTIVREVQVVDHKKPEIVLKGQASMRVFENGKFEEPGYRAMDNYDGDISKKVNVKNTVNMKKQGMYTITYHVEDASGNKCDVIRKVQVCADPSNIKVYYDHDEYDNTAEEWWFRKSKEHQRTTGAKEQSILDKYDAYYQGPDEKVLYLTFDEGGSDITYIKEIAQILKKHNVRATYFLTRNYIKDNPEFMNALERDGSVVGNHTWHHYDMPTLANAGSIDSFVKELTETEKTYMEITGKPMKKVFRFPKGGSSERAMKIVKDLGYSTYFWSHAYYDYAGDVAGEDALKTLMDHYHEGAIYLLHPNNKGNYEAMDTFVKNMKDLGYQFKTVDEIPMDTK